MTKAFDELFDRARQAQAHAYAPYSNHPVGAALITSSGRVFSGCNVENASSPEGSCAEAGAIAAMVAAGEQEIAEILIVGPGEELCYPCGGCRQRIAEFATSATQVHSATTKGRSQSFPLSDLLPHSFGSNNFGNGNT